ncbi:hypothetical protein BJF78_08695 [Pseudonocardia sp. CNS-139]|nr:hypothetical protein BJF78_08695 [Pseudonocardia sp. CNS-139]
MRSSGEPIRCARSHALSGGSIVYSERTGLNEIVVVRSPVAASASSSSVTSARSAATAASTEGWMRVRTSSPFGSQRTSPPCSSNRS